MHEEEYSFVILQNREYKFKRKRENEIKVAVHTSFCTSTSYQRLMTLDCYNLWNNTLMTGRSLIQKSIMADTLLS